MLDVIHISYGGAQRVIIDAKGKRWDFEMHRYFGPSVTNRIGDIKDKQPGQRSPFWHALQLWIDQGEKLVGDVCQWVEPPAQEWVHLGGKNYALKGSTLALKYGKESVIGIPATPPAPGTEGE